ncbi:MAG: primosomal protein N' [Clostridiales bacterium]|nr:primosomal protein N' [Clostridiales bacterium]
MKPSFCSVRILDLPFHIDRPFDYYIPLPIKEIKLGDFVAVPFGGSNRTSLGVVTHLFGQTEMENDKIKPIYKVVYREFALCQAQMDLVQFMCDQTLCSYGDAVKAVLPVSSFSKLTDVYYPTKQLNKPESALFSFIQKNPGVSAKELEKKLGEGVRKELKKLVSDGMLRQEIAVADKNRKYEELVSLSLDREEIEQILSGKKKIGSKKRVAIIEHLYDAGTLSFETLKSSHGLTRSQLTSMSDAGLITICKIDKYRQPYALNQEAESEFTLSPEQQEASDQLCALVDEEKANAALLFGVTGSGKTQVIKSVIDHVLANGQGVIMLVPEIALTPQMVSTFAGWYGDRIAVMHSGLSAGERFDAWRRIKNGKADICLGTRSAIFAPFENLGLIVMDEEQEHTYKSDQNPKYHARDIARFRCAKAGALMLLASATPSIESFYKAKSNIYHLITLRSRFNQNALPETILADMRQDAQEGNTSAIGHILAEEIKNNLSHGEQSILFVNRRGYNNFLSCNLCGHVEVCPHCSVSLTYHTRGRYYQNQEENIPSARAKNGYLLCHYCGYKAPVPAKCASCENTQMQFMGFGTQLAENLLQDTFPSARITRMDADTTQNKFAYDEITKNFRNGTSDILLGTQMVTKGHDFPDVTLVGVLEADSSLYLDDYRANERTFSLVTQVVGRAGRANKSGRAIIQTYSPDHSVLQLAARQDYETFYQGEIALRRALVFPPFCDMAVFTFSSRFEENAIKGAALFTEQLKERLTQETYKAVKIQAFGPFEAPIYKKQDTYRMRLILKCVANQATRSLFASLLRSFEKECGKLQVTFDLNPSTL